MHLKSPRTLLTESSAGSLPVILILLFACCLCGCRTQTVIQQNHTVSQSSGESGNESSGSVTGGPCQYDFHSGRIRVTEIAPEPGSDMDSASDLMVRFEFAREDGRPAGFAPVFERNPDYQVRLGKSEVRSRNINKGAEYRATVGHITTGTCVPYSFRIDW